MQCLHKKHSQNSLILLLFTFLIAACGQGIFLGDVSVPKASGGTAVVNADGTMTVTITGTGFVAGATVTVSGTPCTNVKVQSWTQLTCDLPSAAIAITNIVVIGTNGAALLDTFSGADNTMITNHTANSSQSWSLLGGGGGLLAIFSNLLTVAPTSPINQALAIAETGKSDYTLTVDLHLNVVNANTAPAVFFRVVDFNNLWYIQINQPAGPDIILNEKTAGVLTQRAATLRAFSTGTKQWTVTVSGTSISSTYDGTTVSFTSSSQQTATKVGLMVTGATGDNSFGNLKVIPP